PADSKKIAEVIGYATLNWKPAESAFAGFNRTIKEPHVIDILQGLKNEAVIIPNPLIAYFLSKNFRFKPDASATPPIEVGVAEILADDGGVKDIGFVIDGQHRLEALKRRQLEEGEEDLVVGVVAFHAPANEDERKAFDDLVLQQMAIINQS